MCWQRLQAAYTNGQLPHRPCIRELQRAECHGSLYVSAQVALPDWARGRGLAVFLSFIFGATKEGTLAKAQLALSRTRVVAPLSGTIGRPHVAPGGLVETIKGMVLAEIAQLDPMEVYFRVPYVERQRALDKAGTSDADDVFDNSTLSLELPSDRVYELSGTPEPHGEQIDQSTDVMTVWAVFPNPHNILVPGLKVHVISHLADQTR